MKKMPRALILFYVLLAYVIAQFLWWAYLLYGLSLDLSVFHAAQPAATAPHYLRNKLWMIAGEGTVFLALLLTGALYIHNFLVRERKLALQEKNFLLATTHELNSPISALKLYIQTMQARDLDPGVREKLLSSSLGSLERLENLVSNVLLASKIDGHQHVLEPVEVNLKEEFHDFIQRAQPLIESAGNSITYFIEGNSLVKLDRKALDLVLNNLLDNALKYAPASPLTLCARRGDSKLFIEFSDQGPGVPASDRTRIFLKFHRLGNEETRSQKGTGLGLFLVRALVEMHGGHVHATANHPKGLKINIELPIDTI